MSSVWPSKFGFAELGLNFEFAVPSTLYRSTKLMDKSLETHRTATTSTFLSLPFVILLVSHVTVDTYSNLVPASLGIIEKTFQLTREQAAWLLGVGSLSSGLAQPIFAWLSDWSNSRVFGGIGIALAAVFICSLGFANSAFGVFAIYILGMIGVGMFHPIAASTIGQVAFERRSLAVSMFFVAGMLGGIIGAVIGSRLIAHWGLSSLLWFIVPGLVVAAILHLNISGISHRPHEFHETAQTIGQRRQRWWHVFMLYVAAAIRFSVNMALVYLFVRLVESRVALSFPELSVTEVAKRAAPTVGTLNGFMTAGMATGGLMAGTLIKPGREKWPLALAPLLFAPAIAFMPLVPTAIGGLFTFLAGMGFASMVPVTLSLAQRLLPERTSLASGLMLGGAWAVAMVGPRIAESVNHHFGLPVAFILAAAALAISGIVLVPMNQRLIHSSKSWH